MTKPNPLLGTWKLKAYFAVTAAGERAYPYADQPSGYLTYSAEGRMQVVAAASSRTAPSSATPAESERAALFDTMFAYAGTYSFDADTVIHHVDVSWNEVWTGTDQVRRFKRVGDTLTVTMQVADSSALQAVQYIAEWERVRSGA